MPRPVTPVELRAQRVCRNGHPFDREYIDRRGLVSRRCSICDAARRLEYVKKNPDREKERLRSYRTSEKGRSKSRSRHLRSKYGIDLDEFQRMCEAQDFKCACCGEERDLVVDHCHKTGAVRALLCQRCNTTIGQVEENPDVLRAMIDYLSCVVTDRPTK